MVWLGRRLLLTPFGRLVLLDRLLWLLTLRTLCFGHFLLVVISSRRLLSVALLCRSSTRLRRLMIILSWSRLIRIGAMFRVSRLLSLMCVRLIGLTSPIAGWCVVVVLRIYVFVVAVACGVMRWCSVICLSVGWRLMSLITLIRPLVLTLHLCVMVVTRLLSSVLTWGRNLLLRMRRGALVLLLMRRLLGSRVRRTLRCRSLFGLGLCRRRVLCFTTLVRLCRLGRQLNVRPKRDRQRRLL